MLKCTLPGHTYQVRALDFSHDDSFLLSGAADETVMIWQMDEATLETEVRQFCKVSCPACIQACIQAGTFFCEYELILQEEGEMESLHSLTKKASNASDIRERTVQCSTKFYAGSSIPA